jgi:hypothetical protein
MLCPSCGRELGNEPHCSFCATAVTPNSPEPCPPGDAFPSAKSPSLLDRAKPVILVLISLALWSPIVYFSYLRALRWAGIMTDEAVGYMIGGCLFPLLVGLLAMYLVAKARGKKSAPPTRFFGVSVVALLISFLSFAGSLKGPPNSAEHQVGDLLRQAAGNKPATADANWWDSPTRDFFHDILTRNQQYIAEVHGLDSSAIKDLYSPDSYAGTVHMQKVVSQLRAAFTVDTKYSSLDPALKSMRERVAAAHASESEKRNFLKGVNESIGRVINLRTELIRTGKVWMDNTLDLYGFMLAHSSDYSIRDTKLYFADSAIRKEFIARQSKAIASHKDFLKAEAAFENSRESDLNQLGVSSSEFTPSQLGRAH